MRLFLDTSVLLAACGSDVGASAVVCRRAVANGWELVVTPYVIGEVTHNLDRVPAAAAQENWRQLGVGLTVRPDVYTVDRPVVFGPPKDRPILFGAFAWADVLLTLDNGDFGGFYDHPFYTLEVLRPGAFVHRERLAGRLH